MGALGGILTPVLLAVMAGSQKSRSSAFGQVHRRLDHLDECFDRLRLEVASGAGVLVTRAELDKAVGYERDERHKLADRVAASMADLATRGELNTVDNRLMTEIRDLRRVP